MEKDFIPYNEALALKELGFDESTYTWRQHGNGISGDVEGKRDYYNRKGDVYTALPTFSQAFRWFREKYNLLGAPQYFIGGFYCYTVNDMKDTKESNRLFSEFETYEEAELACLIKLIEIVETKSTQNTNDGRTMEKLIESNRKFDEKNNDNVKYDSSDRNEDLPNITNFFI